MYQIINESIINLEKGSIIPKDELNKDYINYLSWLSKGNVPICKISLSDAKNNLLDFLYDKYLKAQTIIVKNGIDFTVSICGENFTAFEKIVDRAKSEDKKSMQEFHFYDLEGELYYTILSNLFWVELFGDISRYSAINRRMRELFCKKIKDCTASEELEVIKQEIDENMPKSIFLSVDKIFEHIFNTKKEYFDQLSKSKNILFKKCNIEDALFDLKRIKVKNNL